MRLGQGVERSEGITSIRKLCFVSDFIWKLIISWKLEFINLQHVPSEEKPVKFILMNPSPSPNQDILPLTWMESKKVGGTHPAWQEAMHCWLLIPCCLTIPQVAQSVDPSYLDRCVNTICMVGNPYRLWGAHTYPPSSPRERWGGGPALLINNSPQARLSPWWLHVIIASSQESRLVVMIERHTNNN